MRAVTAVFTSIASCLLFHTVITNEINLEPKIGCFFYTPSMVTFVLYNSLYPSGTTLNPANLLPGATQTVFISHGWTESADKPWVKSTVAGYLSNNPTFNVITVDYRTIATMDYFTSSSCAPKVGKAILTAYSGLGIPASSVSVTGFSLGGQVSGFAARALTASTGEKFNQCTGLDAAGPDYDKVLPFVQQQLKSGDCVTVVAVLTNGQALGFGCEDPYADYNVYINDGSSQPGCADYSFSINQSLFQYVACSHIFAVNNVWTKVANDDTYTGTLCDSYSNFINGGCSDGAQFALGELLNTSGIPKGNYYIITDSSGKQI